MKMMKSIFVLIASLSCANATTISNGGGTSAALFVTSNAVSLTSLNSSFAIGTWDGSTFTQFAPSSLDATPMVIGTNAFAGRLTGNFSDNAATATSFNNAQIWYRVNVNLGSGVTGTSYFAGASPGVTIPATATKFPANGSGVADSLSADTRNLTILGTGSTTGSIAYNAGTNTIVVGVIPEPSAALLGALGALGLLRRRRI